MTIDSVVEQRFWSKVVRGDGCWEWAARRDACGYGKTKIAGRFYRAHRLAWELANGPIPAGLFVCHRCDNPPCVRPDHLFLGTPADNAADMAAKRRAPGAETRRSDAPGWRRGSLNPCAKLKEADVPAIFARRTAGESVRAIARDLRVSPAAIYHIISGDHWQHARSQGRG